VTADRFRSEPEYHRALTSTKGIRISSKLIARRDRQTVCNYVILYRIGSTVAHTHPHANHVRNARINAAQYVLTLSSPTYYYYYYYYYYYTVAITTITIITIIIVFSLHYKTAEQNFLSLRVAVDRPNCSRVRHNVEHNITVIMIDRMSSDGHFT